MANSTSVLPQLANGQASPEITVNSVNNSQSPASLFGLWAEGSNGLVWGYFGGTYAGTTLSNSTVLLTASSTNYIVANASDGVVSASTNTTNWDNQGSYIRLYRVVTSSTAPTSWTDYRQCFGSVTGAVGEANTASNIGATGVGIFAQKSGVDLQFKKLVQGTNVTITSDATTVTINASGGGGSSLPTINTQTGTSYTVVLGDANGYIRMNSSSANTLTIPTNASVAYPVGTSISVRQVGTGATTIVASGGVTINNVGSSLQLRKQQSTVQLLKVGTDEWDLFGDITGA